MSGCPYPFQRLFISHHPFVKCSFAVHSWTSIHLSNHLLVCSFISPTPNDPFDLCFRSPVLPTIFSLTSYLPAYPFSFLLGCPFLCQAQVSISNTIYIASISNFAHFFFVTCQGRLYGHNFLRLRSVCFSTISLFVIHFICFFSRRPLIYLPPFFFLCSSLAHAYLRPSTH